MGGVYIYTFMSIYMYCYAAMCPAGLQGTFRSLQVHQLKQGIDVGWTLFNVTDITNSLAGPHFKATRRVIGELLKVNTANWQAFPHKYKVFGKYNSSTTKKGLWTAVFGLTRLITILFYWIKERKKEKNNSSNSQERESLSASRRSLN